MKLINKNNIVIKIINNKKIEILKINESSRLYIINNIKKQML